MKKSDSNQLSLATTPILGQPPSDLLFELGTEELPPNSLLTLRNALHDQVVSELAKANLKHGRINVFATPRRLALLIRDLESKQPDKTLEKRGPALKAAFNEDGTPTRASEGFARSCGTSVDQLNTLTTDKGEWLCFHQSIKGQAATDLIPTIFTRSLAALPIARRMRWGDSKIEFVRPVHWIVLLYGDQVVDANILGIAAGRHSRGHRFHHPQPLCIGMPSDYPELLSDKGKVMVDFEERRSSIHRQALDAATAVDGTAHIEEGLLNEITALVEWPVAVTGNIEKRYLELPSEVLMTTMQSNQKYFPVKGPHGNPLPYFIAFSNLDSHQPESVKHGNERVIRPRLADAEFFWNQDRKNSLASRVKLLSGIVFQKKLGTLADKSRRVQRLAECIAENLKVDPALVKHAALLAKSDLLTDMVREFPSLQGIIGRYYAIADGEPPEVAGAIEEQYLPKQSGGKLPETQTGRILALAEKIDTVTGIFSAGLIPSGDKDPYALRRAALGVLRIVIEQELDLDLRQLIELSLSLFSHDFNRETLPQTVFDFFVDRQKGYCLDRGYRPDEFAAVAGVVPPRPLDFELRLKAVREFRLLPEAESLAAANKRIRNILKKSETLPIKEINQEVWVESEERALFEASRKAESDLQPLLQSRDYTRALTRLAELRDSVDAFFDNVMVMTEDPVLRRNRLGLLTLIETLFLGIADISKLQ